ncbi:MAG TPA: hypothetical protein VEB63_05035 [Chitinophagaceae bacterium]|nr:hypothetical protein [Chitinophagaceae bacterium]
MKAIRTARQFVHRLFSLLAVRAGLFILAAGIGIAAGAQSRETRPVYVTVKVRTGNGTTEAFLRGFTADSILLWGKDYRFSLGGSYYRPDSTELIAMHYSGLRSVKFTLRSPPSTLQQIFGAANLLTIGVDATSWTGNVLLEMWMGIEIGELLLTLPRAGARYILNGDSVLFRQMIHGLFEAKKSNNTEDKPIQHETINAVDTSAAFSYRVRTGGPVSSAV